MGESEKAVMQKLSNQLDEFDKKFVSTKYFSSEDNYNKLEQDLLYAFQMGDLSQIQTIVNEVDLRRLPMTEGQNYNSNMYELYCYPYLYWPVTLHMIF